ncbi:TetR/AcrR family transcriptional regulator [Streptomyces sp. NRRL F-5123]|uniref:TetR/AcrR family transcriptional regulator n=1 Tax=Streptomyces sp. NRRL F-5123 TaxID=1463856 RepID=UPI0005B8C6C2|nr:TetR/AcrR family transcriptional regulator [Streptomyces sp. NRRL F-5123]
MTDPFDAPSPPVGRRERNKLRVKNRLYDAALRLFVEKGYEQTSVDEIAEEADVARRTFFNYYQRKEDLIDAWGERRRSHLEARLQEPDGASPRSVQLSLERCMNVLADVNESERGLTRVMLSAWVKAGRPMDEEPFAAHIFSDILEEAKRRGEIPEKVNTRGAGYLLRDGYLGVLYRWSRPGDKPLDLQAELLLVCDLVLHGMTARQG